jgi:ABC-type branched-subunit amino acid transport system permease subunit
MEAEAGGFSALFSAVFNAYTGGIVTLLAVNCIAAMGVSLFTGFTGIFTLGHAGYMALAHIPRR